MFLHQGIQKLKEHRGESTCLPDIVSILYRYCIDIVSILYRYCIDIVREKYVFDTDGSERVNYSMLVGKVRKLGYVLVGHFLFMVYTV